MQTYEDFVSEGRSTLELLLSADSSFDDNLRDAFTKTYRNLETQGYSLGFFTTIGLDSIGFSQLYINNPSEQKTSFPPIFLTKWALHIKTPLDSVLSLSKYFGDIKYVCLHELGEILYIYPVLCYMSLLVGSSKLNNSPKSGGGYKPDGPGSISLTSHTDLFGDLLASTFSPLTPEEQLLLLEKRPVRNIRKGLNREEYEFVAQQRGIVGAYMTRTSKGYTYGEELHEIYTAVLELQVGLDIEQRKKFQLVMYDSVQHHMMEGLGKIKHGVKVNFDWEDILADLERLAPGL